MKRWMVLIFATICVTFLGAIVFEALTPDLEAFENSLWLKIKQKSGEGKVVQRMIDDFHHAKNDASQCLRYRHNWGWSLTRRNRLAVSLLNAGLTQRLGKKIPVYVEKWRRSYESKYHRDDKRNEEISFLEKHCRGLDCWILRVNRRAFLKGHHALESPKASALSFQSKFSSVNPKDVARLKKLWKKHGQLLLAAYRVSEEIPQRDTTTGKRLGSLVDRLKTWVNKHGRPPASLYSLGLDFDLHLDGFGKPFEYEIDEESVTLTSHGFDGVRGTADDLVRGFTWPR